MPEEAQSLGDHVLAQPLARVQRKAIRIGSHEVDAVQFQPRMRELPQEFSRLAGFNLTENFFTHRFKPIQRAAAGSHADARIGNRASQEIAELGGEAIRRCAAAVIQQQKRRRGENRNDAFLEGLDFRFR